MSNYSLKILHGNKLQEVITEDDITWTLNRSGTPGKLNFTIVPDENLEIGEGDQVQFYWEGHGLFFGYLFSRELSSDGMCDCIAYDQLRYLKNKDTVVFEDCNSKKVFDLIAGTFGVNLGHINNCNHKFNMIEENKSGLDMIVDYCDSILINTDQMFVVYDDFGEIVFKNVEGEMGLNYLLNENNSEDYKYTISIDDRTYNKIKLVSQKDKSFLTVQDKKHIFDWGLLQLYQSVQGTPTKEKANQMLELYNRPSKNFTIKHAFGDSRVRAGCWIPVHIQTDTELIDCPMIVEKVTHHFKMDNYTMDMTLIGGKGFIA